MRITCLSGAVAVAGLAASASALTFECRWVERVGTSDVIIGGDGSILDASDGLPHRIRLQFGVFDDAGGAAPAGGFVGWNVGTLSVTGNAVNTRTPGRLAPFVFANQPSANGSPAMDPFTTLVDIDATLGTQSPFWTCDGEGNPLPVPPATVRGLNTFISVYEITTDPNPGATNYDILVGGNLIAATEWRTIGTPIPPDCESGTPGNVTYAPFPTPPVPTACRLTIEIPGPGAAAVFGVAGLLVSRRRR